MIALSYAALLGTHPLTHPPTHPFHPPTHPPTLTPPPSLPPTHPPPTRIGENPGLAGTHFFGSPPMRLSHHSPQGNDTHTRCAHAQTSYRLPAARQEWCRGREYAVLQARHVNRWLPHPWAGSAGSRTDHMHEGHDALEDHRPHQPHHPRCHRNCPRG